MIMMVWPEKLFLSDALIEKWFLEAVQAGHMPSEYLKAKSPQDMANALEAIGKIKLAST